MLDLTKTISEQKEIYDDFDMNIFITLKMSGKSYFMEQRIVECLKNNKRIVVCRLNQLNILKAVISPLKQLLYENGLLYEKKANIGEFEIDSYGIKNAFTGIHVCLFWYASSPENLAGCNLGVNSDGVEVFFDEFLEIDSITSKQQLQIKHLNTDFWRMIATTCRNPSKPSIKPKIWMFANPHSPNCLDNELIYNHFLDWEADWDKLANKEQIHLVKTIDLGFKNWKELKAQMFIVPVNFNAKTIPEDINLLLEKATSDKLFKFSSNIEKRLKIKQENNDYIKHYINLSLDAGFNLSVYYLNNDSLWIKELDNDETIYCNKLSNVKGTNYKFAEENSSLWKSIIAKISYFKANGNKIFFENNLLKDLIYLLLSFKTFNMLVN